MKKKNHESTEQQVLFEWASYIPALKNMFAIPNGAHLAGDAKQRAIQVARLKKEGMKPGVCDVFLPYPVARMSGHYAGLFIEMKRRMIDGPSKVSEDQSAFIQSVSAAGYKAVVCYGADEAIDAIKEYLGSSL